MRTWTTSINSEWKLETNHNKTNPGLRSTVRLLSNGSVLGRFSKTGVNRLRRTTALNKTHVLVTADMLKRVIISQERATMSCQQFYLKSKGKNFKNVGPTFSSWSPFSPWLHVAKSIWNSSRAFGHFVVAAIGEKVSFRFSKLWPKIDDRKTNAPKNPTETLTTQEHRLWCGLLIVSWFICF